MTLLRHDVWRDLTTNTFSPPEHSTSCLPPEQSAHPLSLPPLRASLAPLLHKQCVQSPNLCTENGIELLRAPVPQGLRGMIGDCMGIKCNQGTDRQGQDDLSYCGSQTLRLWETPSEPCTAPTPSSGRKDFSHSRGLRHPGSAFYPSLASICRS
jgi:hypothetical protein